MLQLITYSTNVMFYSLSYSPIYIAAHVIYSLESPHTCTVLTTLSQKNCFYEIQIQIIKLYKIRILIIIMK